MKKETKDKIKLKAKLFLKRFFISLGIFSFILFIISFTDIPYNTYHWLGTSNSQLKGKPNLIVLMGGSGMPSPDGLIRTYYTAEAALKCNDAKIIILHPYGENDSLKQLKLMAHELILKGIDSLRIKFAPLGFNTRSQALNVADICGEKRDTLSLLIITSPEHMYRSIRSFLKVGFTKVGGMPTFDTPIDEEKVKDKENTRDTRVRNLSLRYNMWSYLGYELIVIREYCAISYYKIKGWI